jgi:predicted nucleic acid-binding protein
MTRPCEVDMRSRVYIETSVPSFYHETRTAPDMVAMREWTRQWWDQERRGYDLFTSVPVLEELERGQQPCKQQALEMLADIPVLPLDREIEAAANVYIERSVMPSDPRGDALHLALASYHRCHFLLTWNCAHLANANKFEHIRHVNMVLGLFVPSLVTPVQLLGEER